MLGTAESLKFPPEHEGGPGFLWVMLGVSQHRAVLRQGSTFVSPFTCSVFSFSFRELLSSDAMKDYNRARVYLDENYKSQEHFTVNFFIS